MIEKVIEIEDLGVFEDFSWENELPEFKKYNFIFGHNYSGKTTFSRIFRSFERGKIHPDFDEAKFTVKTAEGNKIRQKDLDSIDNIHVFNTEFVTVILSFKSLKI